MQKQKTGGRCGWPSATMPSCTGEYAIVDLSRYKVSPHGMMTVHSHSPLHAELRTGHPAYFRVCP